MPNASLNGGCRIGIDVGGTFTDFVLANEKTGDLVRYKEPSVPEDPSRSVERGLPALLERAGVASSDVELIVHGTTLALNTIIQRKGAKLGLVVSKGNRGVLEIGRAQLANAFSFALQKEEPLVPRRLVLATEARLMHDGSVRASPAAGELEAIARTFRDAKVDAVTVMLLHSYANPDFELGIATELRRLLPGVPITASAQIWPEQREFERCLVSLINAYIQPLMEDYLARLQERVSALGVNAPIYITANNGGSLSLPTARGRPIDTILSGPASGVVAAAMAARPTGRVRFVTVDMGGTSADMSIIQGGEPEHTTRTHVGGLPVIVPVVNVSAIGAGGGSIVWVDPHGVLKVGPQSAGAAPGPICYGRGGAHPTVTDCYLLTGLIDADHFLGGRMKLDRAAAQRALEAVAGRLGMTGPDRAVKAAEATLRVTTAVMATEMTKNIAQRGEDIRDYALVAFGGAGPTQANLIAEDSDMKVVIVPSAPSTFCALGAILADVKRDYVRSKRIDLADPGAAAALSATFDGLEAEAETWIASEGALLAERRFERSLDMRYGEQAYDLPVVVDEPLRARPDMRKLGELFHLAHERSYNFRDPDASIEATTLRLRVVGKVPDIQLPKAAKAATVAAAASRKIYWNGSYLDATVHLRTNLGVGSVVEGPAIVEQEDTTVLVLPRWRGTVDEIGNLIIEKTAS